MILLELAAGLLLLLAGGETLVRGAVGVAQRLKVSPLLIGLTLVGFGTSTPELVTSMEAAMIGAPGIAVGNIVGSNTANILLILGLAAIARPLAASRSAFLRDGSMMAIASVICLAVVLTGTLSRPIGIGMIALLATYVVWTYLRERRVQDASAEMHAGEAAAAEPRPKSLWLTVVFTVGGIALTIAGAHLLVSSSVDLATDLGISESVIGVTIVAVGTSLPELVTSVMAALRNQSDVAFGNIVGSNIYNVLGIMGATAAVTPIDVPAEIAALDIWVMMGATGLLIVFTRTGWRLTRLEGALFLAAYGAYLALLIHRL